MSIGVDRISLVRILIFTGDKFLLLSPIESEFPNYLLYTRNGSKLGYLNDLIVKLPIVPSNINIQLKTSGANEVSLNLSKSEEL